jgi:hypothetical protein
MGADLAWMSPGLRVRPKLDRSINARPCLRTQYCA